MWPLQSKHKDQLGSKTGAPKAPLPCSQASLPSCHLYVTRGDERPPDRHKFPKARFSDAGRYSPAGGVSFPTAVSSFLVQRMSLVSSLPSISIRPSYSAKLRWLWALRNVCTSSASVSSV